MKRLLQKVTNSTLTGLFCLLVLAGCAQKGNLASTTFDPAPYKRLIQITANHSGLLSTLQQKAIQNRSYIVTNAGNFSEFHLIVESRLSRVGTLETKPLLMGRLQKANTPVQFTAVYKLANSNGHILAEGQLSELTETHSTIYPRLNVSDHINAKTLNKISTNILKDIQNHIQTAPWSTTVIGQKDSQHISIAAGEDAGIIIADQFITESQPTAKLQVVMFEKTTTGESRAILGLMEGFLPNAGRKLVPVK